MATCTALADATSTDTRLAWSPRVVSGRSPPAAERHTSTPEHGRRWPASRCMRWASAPIPRRCSAPRFAHASPPARAPARWPAPRASPTLARAWRGRRAGARRRPGALRRGADPRGLLRPGLTPERAGLALAISRRCSSPPRTATGRCRWPPTWPSGARGPGRCAWTRRSVPGECDCPVATAELTHLRTGQRVHQLPDGLGDHPGPDEQFRAFLPGSGRRCPRGAVAVAIPARSIHGHGPGLLLLPRGGREGRLAAGGTSPQAHGGMVGLEYWFLYPYNYYPTVIDSDLMDQAPLAGDTRQHRPAPERLGARGRAPGPHDDAAEVAVSRRHATEGQFIPWDSPLMRFDEGHPWSRPRSADIRAICPACGAGPRALLANASGDWLSCGSGRFAFRGSPRRWSTAAQPWACWPGFFGAVRRRSAPTVGPTRSDLHQPDRPRRWRQAENEGVCPNGLERRHGAARQASHARLAGHMVV